MATVVGDVETPPQSSVGDQTQPLLNPPEDAGGQATGGGGRGGPQNPVFSFTATLANLLPTGTLLVFQILSPVFTNLGRCDVVYQTCTWTLVAVCALSCFVLSFTDSFVDDEGVVRYVFATLHGMWVIDGSPEPPPGVAEKYRMKFIDFVHAFMTVSIFLAVAVLDQRLVLCLYPTASSYVTLALKLVPLLIAVVCCGLFIILPTTRHGIGFPIVAH